MSKVALERVTSSFGFQAAFNEALAQIENEFTEKVLYRDNPEGTTNEMKNDLDMGSHDVLNVKMVDAQQFRVGGRDLEDEVNTLIADLESIPAETMGYRDEAIAARDAAQLAEANAESSEAGAQASANLATTKANAASASASQAAVSASQALAEKQLAALFAGNASQSASDSLSHEVAAEDYAAQAEASANAADISEANALSSANAASVSAAAALVSETNADSSEAAALGYKEDIIDLFAAYTLDGLHTHANKTLLDATQESFTTALKNKLDGIATNANNYSLPVATPSVLGGVKDGTGVTIAGDGTLSVDYGSSSNTACMGNDSRLARVFYKSLATTVGNYVDVGYYTLSNGAHNLLIGLTCSGAGVSLTKLYNIVTQYSTVAWCTAVPLMTTGAYIGQDFELEVSTSDSIVSFRIRRTGGTTAVNCDIYIANVGSPLDAFTLTSGTGVSTASGFYAKSRLPLASIEPTTASRALASDTNGKLVAATTTATELGYVNGVTSAIQTQLNGKASTAVATTSVNGLMSNTDKTKLDGIQAGAQVNANITKAEIEAKLTGVIATHSHSAAVATDSIDNTYLANMAVNTIKGRITTGTGDPEDLTATQVRTILNVANGANAYVHPNHSGDVTSVADGAQTIAANAVTNTKAADMAANTIKGRITASTGDPEDLTATQVRTILNVADGSQKNSDIIKSEIEAKLTGDITSHNHSSTYLPLAGGTISGVFTCDTVDVKARKSAETLVGVSISGATSVDAATGNAKYYVVTGAAQFTLTNVVPATFISLTLWNAGSFAITWPTGIKWPKGVAPTLTASGFDAILIVYLASDMVFGFATTDVKAP